MLASLLLSVLSLSGVSRAAPRFGEGDWFQPRDSAVHDLFKRAPPDPSDPNFASNYPATGSTPPTSSLPKAWTDKLASIQLPDVAPSNPNNGYPTYPDGETPSDQKICSFTYECTTSDDLVNPPDGVIAITFDDGPTSESPTLYSFLAQNNISSKVTHFMIGGNIVGSPTVMQDALHAGGHIAVHTYSHPYMTTLSNEAVLAELGWTMQVIYDLSGGRVPMYWRPPFGDVDNRVRAIAKGVLGLETVPWNQDSGDWAIGNNPQYTNDSVHQQMQTWLTGSKSPGLLILEHETNPNTVGNFEFAYPLMVSNNWKIESVPEAFGKPFYQNAVDSTGSVTNMTIAGSAPNMSAASSSTSSSASASSSSTLTSSASASTTSSAAPTGSQRVDAATTSGGAGRSVSVGASGMGGFGGAMVVLVGTVFAMLL